MKTTDLKIKVKEIENLVNADKSLPINNIINYLKLINFEVEYNVYRGYVDKLSSNGKFAIERKEKNFYEIKISKDKVLINTFDSSRTKYTTYSLTVFLQNEIEKYLKFL